jgi:hypothetical protein
MSRETNWPAYAESALLNIAWAYRARGDLDEALQTIRESLRTMEPPAGESSPNKLLMFASALIIEGQILGGDNEISLGRPQEAVEPLERAAEIAEDLARRDPSEFSSREKVFSAEGTLANMLRHTDPARALAKYDHTLQRLAEIKDNPAARLDEVASLTGSTYALQRLGRSAEARKRLDDAFERLKALKLYPARQIRIASEADEAVRALADYEAATGNVRRGAELYRELQDLLLAAKPKPETSLTDAVALSNLYRAAAPLQRLGGQTDLAVSFEARRLELWQRWSNQLPNNAFVRRQLEAARLP